MTSRDTDWAALHDPQTTPEHLAAVAQRHPEFAAAIAVHPHAYPALREWALAVSRPTEVGAAAPVAGPAPVSAAELAVDALADESGADAPCSSGRPRRGLWITCAAVVALIAAIAITQSIVMAVANNAPTAGAEDSSTASDCDQYLALTSEQRSSDFADDTVARWDENGLTLVPVTAVYDAQCPAHAGEGYPLYEVDTMGDDPRCDVFLGLSDDQKNQWAADLSSGDSWGLSSERSSAADLETGCRELALPTQNMIRLSNYLVDLPNRMSWQTQTQLGYSWNTVLGVGGLVPGPDVVPLGGDLLADGSTSRVYTPGSACGFDPATDAIVPLRLLMTSTTGDADPILMSAGWTLRVREGAQPVSRALLEANYSSGADCSEPVGSYDGARTFVGYDDPNDEIWSTDAFSVVLKDFVSPQYPAGAISDLSAYELVATPAATRSEDPVMDMTPAVIRLDGSRP